MTIDGAVVKEQGITFGIIVVKSFVLDSPNDREEWMRLGIQAFGMMPIILMAQNSNGVPTYWGRKDISQFLGNIDFRRIPWKRYTLN